MLKPTPVTLAPSRHMLKLIVFSISSELLSKIHNSFYDSIVITDNTTQTSASKQRETFKAFLRGHIISYTGSKPTKHGKKQVAIET